MARKKRFDTHTFEWDGASIDLRVSLAAIERLETETGRTLYGFMNTVGAPVPDGSAFSPTAAFKPIIDLFYYFQLPDEEGEWTKEDIHESFFSNIFDSVEMEFQSGLAVILAKLMNLDSMAVLNELEKQMETLESALSDGAAVEQPKKKTT